MGRVPRGLVSFTIIPQDISGLIMFRGLSRVLLCIFLVPSAHAEEAKQWICVAERAAGFAYKDGEWKQGIFRLEGQKYIISPSKTENTKIVYQANRVGNEFKFPCRNEQYQFICGKAEVTIVFNSKILRFNLFNSGILLSRTLEDIQKTTPAIIMGKCSPL
jgi:hypothetical protein